MIDICTRPIIVGFDDHDASRRALIQAAHLASRLEVHLYVEHIVDLEDTPIDPDTADWEDEVRQHLQTLQHHAETLIELSHDDWDYHVHHGDSWHVLLHRAEELDAGLIIVGQHLHARALATALGHFLAGPAGLNVAEQLVRHGNRPILVVPSQVSKHSEES
ncbi:universal stress protein [Flexivirga caeni]|uniref:Universal stress protein n=1 Tax=Flexivirga caeni TaxID=2294115 RepID=A0A3M9MI19_9MICO|nr:universal stress protein [Flexivirga caeni]RNI24835.1 universal stress protein [Flexivirga caeni]